MVNAIKAIEESIPLLDLTAEELARFEHALSRNKARARKTILEATAQKAFKRPGLSLTKIERMRAESLKAEREDVHRKSKLPKQPRRLPGSFESGGS